MTAAEGAIRIATRRSGLAMAQSRTIADRLAAATGREVRLLPLATPGDDTSRSIDELGAPGVFVAGVRRALLDGQADIAVHSMKDLPTRPVAGLVLAAVPARADARDALCASNGWTLGDLPPGATIATGSARRLAQLRAARPDVEFTGIRGNVETRLAALAAGRIAAVVLAAAGLHRLGRVDAITQLLPLQLCTPAPGQGALAVECCEDLADAAVRDALAQLDDTDTRTTVAAERQVLAALEAGCTAPVGAHAVLRDGEITITAVVASRIGDTVVRMSETGPVAAAGRLGSALADRLLSAGAAQLEGERNI